VLKVWALLSHTTITLELQVLQLELHQISFLSLSLRRNNCLRHLNLCGNRLGDLGTIMFAKAIPACTLEVLNLNQNSIGNTGAAAIATGLAQNTSIKTLYLEFNEIGTAGCAALAGALRQNTVLKELKLGFNQIQVRNIFSTWFTDVVF
jgi:Ran GTPase-activating protein (RanGAP) involved in mRNA processing and transport